MPSIKGKRLTCPHCDGESFEKGRAQLNTAGMTFLDLDWLNKSAAVYICTKCGRIEWFVPTLLNSWEDDTSETTVCMSCQAIIPTGEDKCPNCNWSYKS